MDDKMTSGEIIKKTVFIVICALYVCVLSSCRYALPEEKRADVISVIAVIVNDNYKGQGKDTPLPVGITDIQKLADTNSDLYKAIDKYDDVKDYKVYLYGNKVIVVTDAMFQGVKGYVASDEELEGVLTVPGLGFDSDRINVINRLGDSNIYYFSAGS